LRGLGPAVHAGGVLHLIKLAVGVKDVGHLRELQARRATLDPPLRHQTRMLPRRGAEIAGAAGVQVARLRRLAGVLLAVYFVCVFPANIKNAVEGLSVTGLPSAAWYYWIRLAFQPLAIWWALTASGVLALPGGFGRSQRAKSA